MAYKTAAITRWNTSYLLSFASILLACSAVGSSAEVDSGKARSALGLFDLQESSKLWDNDILLKTLDDWKKPTQVYAGNTELDYYVRQGNLATYLGLHHIDAIYLPLPINFIFIGFSGNGNHALKLTETELKRWFEHMDHILEHTRVPVQSEASQPDSPEPHHSHLPLVSAVHYNFTVHAIEMGAHVAQVFEQAIGALARREDPEDNRPAEEVLHQVDMEGMAQIIDNMLDFLQLDHAAYNILVLNPNREKVPKNYGYRLGLSEEEFNMIMQDEPRRQKLMSPKLEKLPQMLVVEHDEVPLFDMNERPNHKFRWKDVEAHETMQWANRYEKLLDGVERLVNDKQNVRENAFRKAQQMLTGHVPKRSARLRKALKEGTMGGWRAECLVDTWVGSHRWAFVDLTAGPFSWGPLVGGEGVRSESSLPSVEKVFQELSSAQGEKSDAELEKDLEELAEERFNFVEEDTAHEVDMLLAEIDVYEAFAKKHCQDRRRKIRLCNELEDRVEDMRSELEQHQDGSDKQIGELAHKALQKLHAWNLFGGDHEADHQRNVSHAWDSFLSHLGASLSALTRHVVTPSTADGAFHFYEKVSFHIYLITQQTYYDKRRTPFDVAELREELASLELPSQKFQFSTHKLSLADDPPLAMAYAGALRSSVVPRQLSNGTLEHSERSYLDSKALQHQLQLFQADTKHRPRKTKAERAILEVPIFVFAVSGQRVLIDEEHLARGLSDMVIGVQLEEKQWESPLHCNGQPIYHDLRSPVKALVAATLEHLGGLLPAHRAHSLAHGRATQDWRWSVGGHPLSATSQETQITAFQHDAAARNFIVTALDESVAEINAGITLLAQEATHEETYRALKRGKERHLIADYNWVVELWKEIAGYVEQLNFGEATKTLALLEERSKSFHADAKEVVAALHPIRCTRRKRLQLGFVPFVCILCMSLIVVLCVLFRPTRLKPKIN